MTLCTNSANHQWWSGAIKKYISPTPIASRQPRGSNYDSVILPERTGATTRIESEQKNLVARDDALVVAGALRTMRKKAIVFEKNDTYRDPQRIAPEHPDFDVQVHFRTKISENYASGLTRSITNAHIEDNFDLSNFQPTA
jgi:hypothetical protein